MHKEGKLDYDHIFHLEMAKKANMLINRFQFNDTEIAKHGQRVSKLAFHLAEVIPYLHQREFVSLYWGTILHDIGKTMKNAGEYNKLHPLAGYSMAQLAGMPQDIAEVILYHHECYDGSGYPCGLKAKDIPFLARICSVVDAFENMTATRSSGRGYFVADVFTEMAAKRGTQFDPDIVDYFFELRSELEGGET